MKSSGQKGTETDAKKGMTRRKLLKYMAASGPLLKAGMGLKASASEPGPTTNVILFLTDQERKIQHFPADWESQNLPGLSRLKQNGVSFENAFTNACMCSPARSTLMSGYFPAQHGVKYTLEDSISGPFQIQLPVDLKNIATVMSAAGFNVVYKGKWHCSKPPGDDGFVPADLAKYGFQGWDPPDGGANQMPSQGGGGGANNDGRYMVGAPSGQEGVVEYLTSPGLKQPFFLVVSLVNPHDVLASPRTWNRPYSPADDPEGFGYDESVLVGNIGIPATIIENLSTKPTVQSQFLTITNLGLGPLKTPQDQQDHLNFYGNLMKASDNYLVQMLDILEDAGLLDNTLIIRTADHGEMGLTHNGQRQKNFNFYEESLRVPLVYSNPNLYKQSFKSNALVSHVDFLPTIASLFNAPSSARADWQGIDYSELVLKPSENSVQDYTVFTYDDFQSGQPAPGPYPTTPLNRVVSREDRYKLAQYYDIAGVFPSQWEMYDRLKDPLETENLAYEGFQRNNEQQRQYERLQAKLQLVKATRLQPLG
ncbi:MAG: sulfatase-like hydrolase/transferase [Candidatus Acidiferrum sp.]|jgi:choline-sulfatase